MSVAAARRTQRAHNGGAGWSWILFPVLREGTLNTINAYVAIVALTSLGVGCSQIVGFKDVSVANDAPVVDKPVVDAPVVDAPVVDAPQDIKPDAQIDAPPPKLWVFVTNAGFTGDFAVPDGARKTVDIKCQDMYNLSFTARGCTNIHAVIQINENDDVLARMATNFQIPRSSEVLRATDETPVTDKWDTLVSPTGVLGAPVVVATTSSPTVPFWSGRGTNTDLQCSAWTSAASTVSGSTGDATKVNAWMAQGTFGCNNFNQHLLCVCW